MGGYLHLLQAPFGAAAAIEHRPDVPFWSGVAAGLAQVFVDAKKVAWGAICTSSKHLSAPPRQ
jgi:hypothetical protein